MVEAGESTTYSAIINEHDTERIQRDARKNILKELAKDDWNEGEGPHGVVAHISHDTLESIDIPVLCDILLNIGDVKTLNLILSSPGGEGTVVEKFVSLCREQCKKFRVIIPHEAKSAATLIALGADEIIMGPSSELGPIDAQVPVVAGGVRRYISAQSFIDARNGLLEEYAEQVKKKEDTQATLQMIASLDMPFINHCERLMDFGRDVAKKFLEQYMFKGSTNKSSKIGKVVEDLSSVKRHKVHGRAINAIAAKQEFKLKVKILGKSDLFWQKVREYYARTQIAISRGPVVKLFESEHDFLAAVQTQVKV